MHCVQIPVAALNVHANLDLPEMEGSVKVFRYIVVAILFFYHSHAHIFQQNVRWALTTVVALQHA